MDPALVLSVSTLGGCSISYGDSSLDLKSVSSRGTWTLLQYLIRHRDRTVTGAELIDLLYPEDKSNQPQSALKTLVHRARERLGRLEYLDGKDLLCQRSGGYYWNNSLPIRVDAEIFESLLREATAPGLSGEEQLRLRLEALALYKGDFLPDLAFDAWVLPVSAYYHYLYVEAVTLSLEAMAERGQYGAIVSLAQGAVAIEPFEERLHYYLISALAHTNQLAAAKTQYETMAKRFQSEFGVIPSEELQELYKKLSAAHNGVELDLGIIQTQMQEERRRTGAFQCEYEFFKNIYRLEARSAARAGEPIHLCLMNVSGQAGVPLPKKVHDQVMARLGESIQDSLRGGDVYSRYSVSQYVVLLPRANDENSHAVMARVISRFRQGGAYPQAEITHSVRLLTEVNQSSPVLQ